MPEYRTSDQADRIGLAILGPRNFSEWSIRGLFRRRNREMCRYSTQKLRFGVGDPGTAGCFDMVRSMINVGQSRVDGILRQRPFFLRTYIAMSPVYSA